MQNEESKNYHDYKEDLTKYKMQIIDLCNKHPIIFSVLFLAMHSYIIVSTVFQHPYLFNSFSFCIQIHPVIFIFQHVYKGPSNSFSQLCHLKETLSPWKRCYFQSNTTRGRNLHGQTCFCANCERGCICAFSYTFIFALFSSTRSTNNMDKLNILQE